MVCIHCFIVYNLQMQKDMLRGLGYSLTLCLISAIPLRAQVDAALSGTVTDPTHALVSAAAVTVKNVDTGAVRTTTTDNAGRYQVVSLPVGAYEIDVTKSGFSEAIRTGVHLVIGQDATVDFTLSLGEVSQHLTVDADAPAVNVSTVDISGLVGTQQVENLPLNGRSFDLLLP